MAEVARGTAKSETKMVCARIPRALHNEMRRVAFERDETVQDALAELVRKYVLTYGRAKT